MSGARGARSKDKKGPLAGTPRLVVPARLRLVDFGVEVEPWVLVNSAARSCWRTYDWGQNVRAMRSQKPISTHTLAKRSFSSQISPSPTEQEKTWW